MNSTTVVSWSDASFLPVLKLWSRHYRRTRPDRMPVVIYTKRDDALEPQRRACAPCTVVALPRELGEAMLRWRLRTVVHALSDGGVERRRVARVGGDAALTLLLYGRSDGGLDGGVGASAAYPAWADDKVIAAVRSLAETGAEGGDPLITITSGETPRIEFNLG